MTLKLAVTITADASSLKSEGAAAKVVVQDLGTTAASAAAGVATVEKALETTASAARQAQSANAALATSQTALAASGATAAQSTRQLDQALDVSSRASREAATALGGLAGAQSALEGSSAQLASHLDRAAISADKFESSALAMVQVTSNLEAALKQTAEAQARFNEQFSKPPVNDNPTKPQVDGAEQLRAKYDELYAIGLRYKEQVAEIRQGHADGKIGFVEMGAMIDRAGEAATRSQDAYVRMSGGLRDASGAVRLTSHQVTNLGYQVNDVATMLLMGASPFQIIASQSGQVVQALGDGPGGVRGSIAAIRNAIVGAVTSINPFVLGITAVSLAAGGLWLAFRDKVQPIGPLIDAQGASIKSLREAYGIAAQGAEDYGKRSRDALEADAGQNQRETIRRQAVDAQRVLSDLSTFAGGGLNDRVPQAFEGLKQAYDAFSASVAAGNPNFIALENTLARIASQDETHEPVRRLADELRAGIRDNATAQAGLRETDRLLSGVAEAAADAAAEASKANAAFRALVPESLIPEADRLTAAFERLKATTYGPLNPQDTRLFERAMADLSRGAEQAATAAQQRLSNLRLTADERTLADIRQRYDAEIAELERVNGSEEALAAKRRERDAELSIVREDSARAETSRQAAYALELQAIGARTAAQKADLAADQARQEALDQNLGAIVANQRAEEARALSARQSREQLSLATESQNRATERQIEQARLELDLVGKSAGEVARLRAEFAMLAQAKDAATGAGFDAATVTLTESMRQQAAEVGRLTEATARLNLERDQAAGLDQLQAELGLVRMSEGARRTALAGLEAETELRRQGLGINDAWGQSYVDNAKRAAAMRGEIDRQTDAYDRQHSVLENVASTFIDMLDPSRSESFFDGMMKGLADISRQFAELGKQKLIETILGKGTSYTTGALEPGQRSTAPAGFPVAANQNVSSSAFIPTPTAAVRQTTQRLAESVTTSVSNNLLESVLGAGKSKTHISGLNTEFANSLTQMFAAAPESVRSVTRINSGFRSVARQAEIFEQAVQKYGSEAAARKWAAPPGRSYHNQGMAADLGYGNSAARQWFHQNAASFGLKFPMSHEPWHIEPVSTRGGGAGSTQAVTQAVREGTTQAIREVARPSPSAGVDPWNSGGLDLRKVTPGANNTGWFGEGGRLQQTLQSPFGQGAMNALGAFGAGQQSGSLSGAFSGGLGAIGMGLGPVGIVAGIGAGLLGGLFGGRQRRKQEHEQRAQAWAAQSQEWQAYQDEVRTGMGPTSGLRSSQSQMAGRLTGFVQTGSAAWKNGTNNSSALFGQVSDELGQYFARTNAAFGRAFESNVRSLQQGQGLDGPFVQAVKGVSEAGKNLLTFVDDTRVVFGDGSEEVARAAAASVESLKQVLSGGRELTEVEEALETLRGAGSAVSAEMVALGVSMEDASREVDHTTAIVIKRIGDDLVRGIQDELAALDGKSYLADFRNLFTSIDGTISDLLAVGGDRSGADQLFARRAQIMVDEAKLTGEAFSELLAVFPRLEGAVREFSEVAEEAAKRSADELTNVRRTYLERYYAATSAGDLAAHERKAQADRAAEAKAGGEALPELEKALAAERAAIVLNDARQVLERSYRHETESLNELMQVRRQEASELQSTIGSLRSFVQNLTSVRDGMRVDDSLSVLGPQERLAEARRQFMDLATKAQGGDEEARSRLPSAFQEYMTESKDFHRSSEGYYRDAAEADRIMERTLATGQRQLTEAERQLKALEEQIDQGEEQLELMRKQYETAVETKDGILALNDALAQYNAALLASQGGGAAAPGPAPTPGYNFQVGGKGHNYLAHNEDVLQAIGKGERFGLAADATLDQLAKAHFDLYGKNEGRKYAWGGLVRGAGTGGSDSISARLSHGEYIMPSAATAAIGVTTLDTMRTTKALPMPSPAQSAGRLTANDNAAVVAAIAALGAQLQQVRLAILGGDAEAVRVLGDIAAKAGTTIATLRRAVDAMEAA